MADMMRPDGFVFLSIDQNADGSKRLCFGHRRRVDAAHGQVRTRGWLAPAADVAFDVPLPSAQKVELTATLTDAYAVGLSAGVDRKRIACAGLKTTDSLIVQPADIPPAGYAIIDVVCTENGWARVGFSRPLLALGANNAIPLKITAFR